jgi:hypothetical protein
MAKLEFYRQQVIPQIATPDTRGLAAVGTQAAETAGAIAQLATIGAKIKENARATKLIELNARATADLNDFVLSLERDSDYETQEERYNKRAQEIESNIQKELNGDNRLYDMWRREFAVPKTARAFDVKKNALRGTIQKNRATLDDSLYTFSQLSGSGNPELEQYVFAQGTIAIDQALESGDITPEEAVNRRQEFLRLTSNNAANRALLTDPQKFEIDLVSGEYSNLPQADRLAFEVKAANQVEQLNKSVIAQQEQERKRLADEAQKDFDELLAQGSLTRSMIVSRRDELNPDDYRYFLKAVTGGAAESNMNIYSNLLVRASSGQDVTKEAQRRFAQGSISKPDFDRLVSISSGSGWYKRGSQLISGALRVSELNPDPASAQRLANAINDWVQWAQSADPEKITDEKALAEANRIIKEYAIIDTQNNVLTLRAPRYLVGSKERPDFDATEDATTDALERNEISQQEFNQQAALIQRWRQAVSSMQSAQAPTESGARR